MLLALCKTTKLHLNSKMICLLPKIIISRICSKDSTLMLSLSSKTICFKGLIREACYSNRCNHNSHLRSKLCGTMAHPSCLISMLSRMTSNKSRSCSHRRFRLMLSSSKTPTLMMHGTQLLETTTKAGSTSSNQLRSRPMWEDSSQTLTQICL